MQNYCGAASQRIIILKLTEECIKMNNETEQIFLVSTSSSQPPAEEAKINQASASTTDVDDFSTVCRTCATVTEFVIPIFDGEGVQNNLAEKIAKHLPIQVSEQDVLPRVVCYQCASTLLAWHELVQCCVQADAALRARLAHCPADRQKSKPDTSKEIIPNSSGEKQQKDIPPGTTEIEIKPEPGDEEGALDAASLARPADVVLTEDGKKYSPCEICKRSVPLSSWRRHARAHRGEKRYSCDTCGLGFGDSGNLARHTRAVHSRHRPHACSVCQKSFSRKSHLQDHLRSHSENREFVCDVCGKASKSGAALRMHRKIHDVCKFECMECGSRFKRRSELRAHVTVHTGEKAHACECGRSFRLRSQLTTHARTHRALDQCLRFKDIEDFVVGPLEPPQYAAPALKSCVYCLAEVPEQFFKEHLVTLHSDYLFHCDECDTYVDRKEFLLHMSLHAVEYATKQEKKELEKKTRKVAKKRTDGKDENENGERVARKCYKRSGRSLNRGETDKSQTVKKSGSTKVAQENEFSDHSDTDGFGPLPESVFEAIEDSQESQQAEATSPTIEADESSSPAANPAPKEATTVKKIRTCQICGKAYTASSSYFYHMKHFHGRSRDHECPTCGKGFATRAALAQHEPVHTGACAYSCDSCGKRFRSRASLYIHSQTHGGEKRWACTECGRGFRWRAQLARHTLRHAAARAFTCAACPRAFSVRADLLRHARTHTRQHHACPHCGDNFAQLRYLKVHLHRKHPTAPEPPADAKTAS